MNEWMKKMQALTSANIHHFLDEMNYILTQTDRANQETQYCDWTHLKPFADLDLKFPNPDPV